MEDISVRGCVHRSQVGRVVGKDRHIVTPIANGTESANPTASTPGICLHSLKFAFAWEVPVPRIRPCSGRSPPAWCSSSRNQTWRAARPSVPAPIPATRSPNTAQMAICATRSTSRALTHLPAPAAGTRLDHSVRIGPQHLPDGNSPKEQSADHCQQNRRHIHVGVGID